MEKLNTKQTLGIIGMVLTYLGTIFSVGCAVLFLILTIIFIDTVAVGVLYLLFLFAYLCAVFFQIGTIACGVYTAQILNKKNEIKIHKIMQEKKEKEEIVQENIAEEETE